MKYMDVRLLEKENSFHDMDQMEANRMLYITLRTDYSNAGES